MDISVQEYVQRTVVIKLLDRLDIANVASFQARTASLLEAGISDFVVDLSQTSFVDSAGMSALATLLKRCRRAGGNVRLVPPQYKAVQRMLKLTGFDKIFDLVQLPITFRESAVLA